MVGELFCPTEYNQIAGMDFSKTLCFVDNKRNQELIQGMRRQLVSEELSSITYSH